MVSLRMICAHGRNQFMIYLFLMALFMIYLLIYQNLKPPSLPWKKPQPVHRSFLQKLVIFHQFFICLLKYISQTNNLFPILIQKVIYKMIYILLHSWTHFPNHLMTKILDNPQVHQLENLKIAQFPMLCHLCMLILCLVCILLAGNKFHWNSWE